MDITFPANTIASIIAITATVVIAFWFIWAQGLKYLPFDEPVKRNWRRGAAVVLGLWITARMGLLSSNQTDPIAIYLQASLVLGLLLGILPLILLRQFRQIVRAIPEVWLVGVQATRVGGFVFLALLDMRLLPPEFALPAGIGDMTVGVLALGVMYAIVQQKAYARQVTIVWNLFGLLDFIVALMTGLLYIGPFAAGLAESGASLHYLSYVFLIPSIVVPLFSVMHLYSLYQIFSRQYDKSAISRILAA